MMLILYWSGQVSILLVIGESDRVGTDIWRVGSGHKNVDISGMFGQIIYIADNQLRKTNLNDITWKLLIYKNAHKFDISFLD